MKILDYLKYILKGEPMKIKFNPAQLSRPQNVSLVEVLDVLQAKNKNELVVTPVEFPIKLKVKLDDATILLEWDAEKGIYETMSFIGEPVPEPEPTPEPEPEPEPKMIGIESVIERSESIAYSVVKLAEPLSSIEQRKTLWIRVYAVVFEELIK